MPTKDAPTIDALAAPVTDGDVVVWPRGVALATLARRNQTMLGASDVMLLDRPLRHWRQIARGDRPVILAGHQPEFIHPGVWAKHPAVRRVAELVDGVARYLLVDSDVPHQLVLTWPADDQGRLRRAWAPAPGSAVGLAFESYPAVPADTWRAFFDATPQNSPTALSPFADAFIHAGPATDGRAADYVSRWIAGVRAVETELGMQSPEYLSVAGIFSGRSEISPAAAAFTAHLLLTAERFAVAYNDALAAYRRRRGLRGRQHPIPDLHTNTDVIELPFWIVSAGSPRKRLFVSRPSGGKVLLYAASDRDLTDSTVNRSGEQWQPIAELPIAKLREEPDSLLHPNEGAFGIRPRALALTLFARLVVSDLFIHGIGGAKYDQITDALIQSYFCIEPPALICVSATLRLPLTLHDVSRSDARRARYRLRDVRFNPQRYLDGPPDDRTAALLEERAAAIRVSDMLRAGASRDRTARRSAYEQIRRANQALLESSPAFDNQLRAHVVHVEAQLAHNEIAGSREWFFALQPMDRLRMLAERVQREVS